MGGLVTVSKCLLVLLLCVTVFVEGTSLWSLFKTVTSIFTDAEKCDKEDIPFDVVKLNTELKSHLFGQHIVNNKLVALIDSHVATEPKKALVICMHGWTGCGKNYATEILIRSLYKLGGKSRFVHYFSGRLHFPLSSAEAIARYKIELQNWIRGNVSACPQSIFVFDEADKIPPEVVNSAKPFFDYYSVINSVDYRKAIFIFLSNIGGGAITNRYMELWENGISREKMTYRDFEPILRKLSYTSPGAFENSAILENHLVSLHLPFLPLEKEHVRKCIIEEMARQKRPPGDDVELVMEEMEFYMGKFSVSGCKRVSDQVAMLPYKTAGDTSIKSRNEF